MRQLLSTGEIESHFFRPYKVSYLRKTRNLATNAKPSQTLAVTPSSAAPSHLRSQMSSQASSESAIVAVSEGHVALVLLQGEDSDSTFYLEVPVNIIESLCMKPRKYLLFLGWCILGVDGVLAREQGGVSISTNGDLEDQGVYHYVANGTLGMFLSRSHHRYSCLQDTYRVLSAT